MRIRFEVSFDVPDESTPIGTYQRYVQTAVAEFKQFMNKGRVEQKINPESVKTKYLKTEF